MYAFRCPFRKVSTEFARRRRGIRRRRLRARALGAMPPGARADDPARAASRAESAIGDLARVDAVRMSLDAVRGRATRAIVRDDDERDGDGTTRW